MNTYYAHSPDNAKKPWHILEDHLLNSAEIAKSFSKDHILGQISFIATLWHDLGKYNLDFQNYIKNANSVDSNLEEINEKENASNNKLTKKVDHSTAGALHAIEYIKNNQILSNIIAFCIAGHHAGLSNSNDLKLRIREKKFLLEKIKKECHIPKNILEVEIPEISFSKEKTSKTCIEIFLLTKMIFSCLVDADFLDTESYYQNSLSKENITVRSKFFPLKKYWEIVSKKIEEYLLNTSSQISVLRNKVLEECLQSAEKRNKKFSLTVPTGGGKTFSSLAFALKHAIQFNKERIIIVLPFTTIIEQTAEVFRNIFKELGDDCILDHHCNSEFSKETNKLRLASENWDCPIIITTQVQFFESIFSNKTSKSRKIHNIKNSVIIFDEAQSLSIKYLEPILLSLDILSEQYLCTLLFTTATQPCIHKLDEITNKKYLAWQEKPTEIISNALEKELWKKLERVKIHWQDTWDSPNKQDFNDIDSYYLKLSSHILMHNSALIIVHNKREARCLFKILNENNTSVYHLSTNMCPIHRLEILKEVKRKLESEIPCYLVSTQLIEAGVDIDFPVVYRAMAGFEALAQSAGRCNRNAKLNLGQFYVFDAPSSPPDELKIQKSTAELFLKLDREINLFSPQIYSKYFEEIYKKNNLDIKKICPEIKEFNFKNVGDNFKIIEENSKQIYISYNSNAKEIFNEIKTNFYINKEILQKMQKYSISIFKNIFDILKFKGIISEIYTDIWVLDSSVDYHQFYGFCYENEKNLELIF